MRKNAIATASLADYAAVINDEHQAAHQCAAHAIGHARVAGEHLLKAKAAMPHGEWLPWLAANVNVSERQCRKYMQLAGNWPAISAKLALGADLTINGALDALAKATPKPEPERSKSAPSSDLPMDPPAADPPAAMEQTPEPQKPVKPIKPAEVEKLQAENEELNSQLAELAKQQEPLQDEVTFLRKIEDEGDKLKAACAEVKRLQALVRVQEERIRGLMNEKNEAVRAAKMWKAKFEKAERAAA